MTKTQTSIPPLALCVLLDIIGYASFSVPLLGEFADLIWAPLSGLIFYRLFGGKAGFFGGIFSFVEEILPFTDFIPTFTIAWLLRSRNAVKMQRPIPLRIK